MRNHSSKLIFVGRSPAQPQQMESAKIEPSEIPASLVFGTSGKAHSINSTIVGGGNPFEGPRSAEFPLPPLKNVNSAELFAKAGGTPPLGTL